MCYIDALKAWGQIAEKSPVPIAGAELLEHPEDFQQLIDAGVQILHPWPVRVGTSGTCDVIRRANRAGVRVILGGWNATTIGVAAGIHLAAGLGEDQIVLEHVSRAIYSLPLRDVRTPEPMPVHGRFALSEAAGLGVSLDADAVKRLRVS